MERQLSSTLRNRVGSSRAGVKTKPAGLKFVATPPRPNKSRDDAQILAGDREENIGESSRLQSVVDEVESNRKENETKAVSLLHENEDQNEVEILYVVTAANRPKKKRLELLT